MAVGTIRKFDTFFILLLEIGWMIDGNALLLVWGRKHVPGTRYLATTKTDDKGTYVSSLINVYSS